MLQRGALSRRLVGELREDQSLGGDECAQPDRPWPAATAQVCLAERAGGQREVQAATGQVPVSRGLRSVSVQLPATGASELKAWVHKITPEWRSETVPARLSVRCGGEAREFDLALCGGQIVLPTTGEACELEITLAGSS
jgi:hypothetical protein